MLKPLLNCLKQSFKLFFFKLFFQYSVLLFIVFCVELGIGIWALVEYDSVNKHVFKFQSVKTVLN